MPGFGYMKTLHPHWHEALRMGVTPAQGAGVVPGVHGPHAVAAPGVTQFTGAIERFKKLRVKGDIMPYNRHSTWEIEGRRNQRQPWR